MKNKKIVLIFIILLIIVIVGGVIAISIAKKKTKEENIIEYTPEEEISEEQLRQTIVTLYFVSNETGEIMPEARLIDIKEIISSPYDKLVNLLIEGPKNEKARRVIPENTTLLKTFLEGDSITLDFSKEFLNHNKEEATEKDNLINTIVNTLTELTEINSVKILVEGEQVEDFPEVYTRTEVNA